MRIWIINQYASTPLTAVGGRHYHFARDLVKLGHEVVVIAARQSHLSRDLKACAEAPAVEVCEGFRFVRIDVPSYTSAHSIVRLLGWLLFAAKLAKVPGMVKDQPDVILCSSPSLFSYLGAEYLAKKYKAKLTFEIRDIWPQTLIELGGFSTKNPAIALMQYVEDRAYRVSNNVVSNLPNSVEHMVSRGLDREKFTWIPNGFSREEIESPSELEADYAEKIPDHKFLVGYTGAFGVANALGTIIDAAILLKNRTDIAFVLIGHGPLKKALQERVREEGLENVHILDAVTKDKVQSALKLFDACYIGLTRNDLFRFGVSPNKLFDYLVAGKPIIYGIDSGDYKPVEDFGAGFNITPETPHELVEAVLRLQAMTQDERQAMGERGKQAAYENHEYSHLARKLEQVLLSN